GKRDCTSGNDGKPGKCMTHELWATLNRKMVDYLDSVSLQDLVDQQRVRQFQEASNQAQACAVRVNRVGGANTAANSPTTAVAANATV
ncbi:MAG: DNA-binding protein, partial [Alcaligenes sp.]